MNDQRFIELVNLYIDRQMSSQEAVELEAELQADPRRRQVYQEYCRMHRATQLVYESFRQEAGQEAPQPATRGGTLVRLESARRRRSRWAYALGGMAAAACVGLLLSGTYLAPTQAGAPTAAPQPGALAATAPQPAPAPPEPLPGSLASLRHPIALDSGFAGRLSPLQLEEVERALVGTPRERSLFDDDVFTSAPLLPDGGQRTYRNRRGGPSQPATEFTAFQFQR